MRASIIGGDFRCTTRVRRARTGLTSALLGCWLAAASGLHAQTLNQEMPPLADRLNRTLVAAGYKNVAALDFTDLQGRPTELGRHLSERLVVELVLTAGVSVADRANIKSILAEHKLTEEGLVNPANAKKLGEFAGVDAILTGTVTEVDAGWELLVKAISTESAKIVAAGRITFPKTTDNQQAGNRGVASPSGGTASPVADAGDRVGASYEAARAIATKDLGSLRVVLNSVVSTRARAPNGQTVNRITCTFEFINLETRRPIAAAMNALASGTEGRNAYTPPPGLAMGSVLRSRLVDDRGVVWSLSTTDVTGVGVVSVGRRDRDQVANPAEIATLLQRQDELGTNERSDGPPSDGRPDPNGSRMRMQQTQYPTYKFVFGSTTPISPGQSLAVTMNFEQDGAGMASGMTPKFLQLAAEIVVAVESADGRKSYSLQNLIFDRVSVPTGGR